MYENDYAIEHHFKACLTKEQIDHLWSTGHCHSHVTGLPLVAPDGLLFCKYLALLGESESETEISTEVFGDGGVPPI